MKKQKINENTNNKQKKTNQSKKKQKKVAMYEESDHRNKQK